jgi:hypothetical protein
MYEGRSKKEEVYICGLKPQLKTEKPISGRGIKGSTQRINESSRLSLVNGVLKINEAV